MRYVELRLVSGSVPHFREMVELAHSILKLLAYEFGTEEVIKRFTDPLWFNSFACLLGMEWYTSGMTTVTLKAVKLALEKEDLGLYALGGKGKEAKITEEIEKKDIKDKFKEKIKEISIFTAKTDSLLVQDNYNLYFHFILFDEKGNLTVIDQKMSVEKGLARRLHWEKIDLNDPHIGFGAKEKTLNLATKEAEETRDVIVELLKEKNPKEIYGILERLRTKTKSLFSLNEKLDFTFEDIPKKIYIKALEVAKNVEKFEDLFKVKGIGPKLLKSLVYVAHIVYGTPISWKDPVIYAFAHGTKSGRPYYVRKKLMLEEAEVIKNAIEEAKIGKREKLEALGRLKELIEL